MRSPHQPGWRRLRGRRRINWLHQLRQVCTDLNLLASDASNLALDRTSRRAVETGFRAIRYIHDDDCYITVLFCYCPVCRRRIFGEKAPLQ